MPDPLAFTGTISCATLCAYLSRAVTYNNALGSATPDDDLRMLRRLGARFLGRAAYVWTLAEDDDRHFADAARFAARVHDGDPATICQAAVFEAVYPGVDRIAIPAWVFHELGEPVETRTFRYGAMFGADFATAYRWSRFGDGCQVPDLTRPETRRWLYYRCRRYIDAGYEAIHLGQPHLYAGKDRGWRIFADLVARVRAHAAAHARRRLVLLDAHTHGVAIDGRLLFDLHSRPISARAVIDRPERIVLQRKGRSLGGIAPSGWRCDSLPYLIEIDNWGGYSLPPERWSDLAARAAHGRWGWDDIAWFAHQDGATRDHFLRYAHRFWRCADPMAFFQMPARRLLGEAAVERATADGIRRLWHYHANQPSPACPDGFGQEATIAATWSESDPPWLATHHAAGDAAVAADGRTPPEPVVLVGDIQAALGGVPGDSVCPHARLTHRGAGRYALATVLPWAGTFTFAVAAGGTMTEVFRQGGLTGGAPWRLRTAGDCTRVRITFDLGTGLVEAVDEDGRSLLVPE